MGRSRLLRLENVLPTRVVSAAVIASLLALTGCGSNSDDGSTSTGATDDVSITVAANTDVVSWNMYNAPGRADEARDLIAWKNIYERLYDFDPDGELTPQLADALPERVDPRTYRIPLKEGVEFSDGRPLTADDVVYSFQTALDPATKTTMTEILVVEGTKVLDPLTVEVTFKQPTAVYAQSLATLAIVPKGFTDWEHPIGTGPYVLKSYTAGQGAELALNENYHGPKPQITSASVKIIPDAGTRMQALKTGEVDLVYGISTDDVKSAPKVTYSSRASQSAFVRINFEPPPLDDVRVRQAMNYAVNKQEIVDSLFGEAATVSRCQLYDSATYGGDPSLEPYPYDPEKARQLLEDADAVGTKVSMESTSGFFPQDRNVAQAITQQLEAVGFDMELKVIPTSLWLEHTVSKGKKGPGADMRWLTSGDVNSNMFRIWGSIATTESVAGTYENPEFDKLFSEALAAQDEETFKEKTAEANKMLCDEAVFLFIYDRKGITALSENVEYVPSFSFDSYIEFARIEVS